MNNKASAGQRIGAFLIDLIISVPLGLIWLIPIIGTLVGGFALLVYWLLRDLIGPSIGKRLTGLAIVKPNGGPAGAGQLVLRNLPLALPYIILMIPLLGTFIGAGLDISILLIELIFVVADGRRLGDKMAGTVVVVKK